MCVYTNIMSNQAQFQCPKGQLLPVVQLPSVAGHTAMTYHIKPSFKSEGSRKYIIHQGFGAQMHSHMGGYMDKATGPVYDHHFTSTKLWKAQTSGHAIPTCSTELARVPCEAQAWAMSKSVVEFTASNDHLITFYGKTRVDYEYKHVKTNYSTVVRDRSRLSTLIFTYIHQSSALRGAARCQSCPSLSKRQGMAVGLVNIPVFGMSTQPCFDYLGLSKAMV